MSALFYGKKIEIVTLLIYDDFMIHFTFHRTTMVGNDLIVHQSNQNETHETDTINNDNSIASTSSSHQYSSASSTSPQTVTTTKASIDSFSAIEKFSVSTSTLNEKSPITRRIFTASEYSTNIQRDSTNNITINHSVDRMSGRGDNHVTILSIESEEIDADNEAVNDESNMDNNFCTNEFSNRTINELSNICSNNLTYPTPDVSDQMSTDHKTDNCKTKNLVNTHQNFENNNNKKLMLDSHLHVFYGMPRVSRSHESSVLLSQMNSPVNRKCESGIS
jgi:hypothetical protein